VWFGLCWSSVHVFMYDGFVWFMITVIIAAFFGGEMERPRPSRAARQASNRPAPQQVSVLKCSHSRGVQTRSSEALVPFA
jgi:hypothetical protein